jgi:hypothetical protein
MAYGPHRTVTPSGGLHASRRSAAAVHRKGASGQIHIEEF